VCRYHFTCKADDGFYQYRKRKNGCKMEKEQMVANDDDLWSYEIPASMMTVSITIPKLAKESPRA